MIPTVVLQTLRELARGRASLALGLWASLAALVSPTAASLVLGQASRGLFDVLLSSLWLLGCALAVSFGLLVARSDNVVLGWLAPIGRGGRGWHVGRSLGLLSGCALLSSLGVAAWALIVLANGHTPPPLALLVVAGFTLEWVWLALLTRLLRLWTPATPAAIASVALWVVAHLEGPYARLAEQRGGALPVVHEVVWTLLPDLPRFDAVPVLLGSTAPTALATLTTGAYGLAWWACLTALLAWAAPRQDWT